MSSAKPIAFAPSSRVGFASAQPILRFRRRPTGKSLRYIRSSVCLCQASPGKIFLFRFSEYSDCIRPSRFHMEGRLANRHRRWKRDAMDVLVSPGGRDRRGRAKPRGPDTPTLVSSLAGDPARRRRLSSPVLRGDRGISRKPSRRECRIVSANLWWLTRVLSTHCTRGYGCASIRHSLRPP